MSLNISSKQMDITPAIRTHIEERLAKFDKFQLQLINPHFIIIKQPNSYEVDATIGSPLGDLVAKAENEDLYNAINDLAKKLEAQRKEQEAANAEKAAAQAQQAQSAQTAQTQPAQQTAKSEAKKPEPVKKPEPPKKAEVVKAEPVKTEPAKTEQPKKAEPKPAEQQVQAGGKKFGLQCGAFKNRAQAESLQGRLAMAGVNAQIATSEEWNRVRVGPFGSRDAATAAQDKAKSVASCVVIGM